MEEVIEKKVFRNYDKELSTAENGNHGPPPAFESKSNKCNTVDSFDIDPTPSALEPRLLFQSCKSRKHPPAVPESLPLSSDPISKPNWKPNEKDGERPHKDCEKDGGQLLGSYPPHRTYFKDNCSIWTLTVTHR